VTLAKRKPNWRKQAKSGWSIWKEKSLSKQFVGEPLFRQVALHNWAAFALEASAVDLRFEV
jgi:hypothetical protein